MENEKIFTFDLPESEARSTPQSLKTVLDQMADGENYVIQIPFVTADGDLQSRDRTTVNSRAGSQEENADG